MLHKASGVGPLQGVIISALAVLFAGCASTQMVSQADLPQVRSDSPGVIAVRRSGSWLGGAFRIAVYVNEKKIGELGPSGTLTCQMDPGPIRLRVRAMELRGGGSISGKTYAELDDALRRDQRKSYECGLQSPFSSSGIYIKNDQPIHVWPVRDGTSNTSNTE